MSYFYSCWLKLPWNHTGLSLRTGSEHYTTNSERALNTEEMCEMADFTWGESVVKLFIYYKLLFICMANALRTNTTIMFFA